MITSKAVYRVLFNRRKNKTSRDGRFPIEVEAYLPLLKERKYFPTTIRVLPEEWNERDKLIIRKNRIYISLNRRIRDLINQFEEIEEEYWNKRVPFHLKYLTTKPREEKEQLFTKFWETQLKGNPKNHKENTKNAKRTALNYLKAFQGDILFTDINYDFVSDYEDFLLETEYKRKGEYHPLKPGFIHNLLKDFQAMLNVAIDDDLFVREQSPFKKFKIHKYRKYESGVKYLTPEEVNVLAELKFDEKTKHLIKIRDMFLLAAYTGLRYGDVVRINKSCLVEKPGGIAIDIHEQEKTDEPVYIPVFKMFNREPERIIKSYLAKGRNYLFDDISNAYVNRELKTLASMAGITKNLTFHMGRHTCATWLLSNGLSIEFVKEILGHKSIKTTQIYAKVLNLALERELEKISY